VGSAIAHGLDGTSTAVAIVAAALAWLVWGAVVVAVLVPRTVSLTALRVAAPAALAASVWATVHSGDVGVAEVAAIAWTALLAAIVLFVPALTDVLVDGSSYGPERRMALRTPGPLLLGPIEIAWVVVVAGVSAGPLLLAARAWVAGGVAVIAGALLVRPALRSLHQLSRRWLVFVRVGFVLHDPLALADPALFQREDVVSLGPAPADAEGVATDLTGRALGLALELRLRTNAKLGLIERRGQSRTVDADRLLFTPARPGALLSEARERGIG
jgi:hypothetical protein